MNDQLRLCVFTRSTVGETALPKLGWFTASLQWAINRHHLWSFVETRSRAYMIPKECKRLAEVDFPIAEVSRHAAREKSIRHGHPSTLHLWWARRPLASSRTVLLALLLGEKP